MRPGYTQTDVTHPVSGWGGANAGVQHLRRIPNCSEVPDTCFLWYFVQFFFFFFISARHKRFFLCKNQTSVAVLRIRLRFWCMIPMGVKYNDTKFERETQRWRPGTGLTSGGPLFPNSSKMAQNCHFLGSLGA